MSIRHASRTINPLHFEDLEPHRFEDLVRQLAYGYRSWRSLEATGRLGRDGGLDIRGREMVTVPPALEVDVADDEGEEISEDTAVPTVVDEREWRIQCKRYKEIGPKLMREIVAETIPDPTQLPYGLIVAAACDVSAETMAAFREEARARGVSESHLWTKAHLEDFLFLPENDHLLFAYFGISLTIRRRSEVQRVREHVALKRKLLRAFKLSSTSGTPFTDVLIRDIADTAYPVPEDVPGFETMRCPPWHTGQVQHFHWKGLWIYRHSYDGWVKEDGSWDLLASSRTPVFSQLDQHNPEEKIEERWARRSELRERIPPAEQQQVHELWRLPYRHILEVDPIGDPRYDGPHLYCRFDGQDGPYVNSPDYIAEDSNTLLDPDKRRPLCASLTDESGGG